MIFNKNISTHATTQKTSGGGRLIWDTFGIL